MNGIHHIAGVDGTLRTGESVKSHRGRSRG